MPEAASTAHSTEPQAPPASASLKSELDRFNQSQSLAKSLSNFGQSTFTMIGGFYTTTSSHAHQRQQ